jgi:hypothetical protein
MRIRVAGQANAGRGAGQDPDFTAPPHEGGARILSCQTAALTRGCRHHHRARPQAAAAWFHAGASRAFLAGEKGGAHAPSSGVGWKVLAADYPGKSLVTSIKQTATAAESPFSSCAATARRQHGNWRDCSCQPSRVACATGISYWTRGAIVLGCCCRLAERGRPATCRERS